MSILDGMIGAAVSLIDVEDIHLNPEYVRGMAELIAVCMDMVSVADGRERVSEQIEKTLRTKREMAA